MAWTAPRTWTDGEVPTASQLNTHIRDNMDALARAVLTTTGDMVRATGANALARFAKPTARTALLRVASGLPAWQDGNGLLALLRYAPATEEIKSTNSTSFVDLDATNLVVTFVVPASGAVLVRLTSHVSLSGAVDGRWNLRESSSDVAGTDEEVLDGGNNCRVTTLHRVSGLTPGNSHTYKWGHAVVGVGTVSEKMGGVIVSDDGGAAYMEVWAG
jgi:hypothetical protein